MEPVSLVASGEVALRGPATRALACASLVGNQAFGEIVARHALPDGGAHRGLVIAPHVRGDRGERLAGRRGDEIESPPASDDAVACHASASIAAELARTVARRRAVDLEEVVANGEVVSAPPVAAHTQVRRVLARDTNQSVAEPPLPAVSMAPPKINAIEHEGQFIATGAQGCRDALERIAEQSGAEAATAWATRFYNMESARRAALEVQYGKELVDGTITALKTAEHQFCDDNDQFLMSFEQRAGNLTDELLVKSESEINKERARLGLDTVLAGGGPSPDQIARLRGAASTLVDKRQSVDQLRKASFEAQEAASAHARDDPFAIDSSLPVAAQKARAAWTETEQQYDDLARRLTAEQPILAMYATGGDVVTKLKRLIEQSAGDPTFFGFGMKVQLDKKLENIGEVRSELGGRFNLYKQPTIVKLTKESLSAKPYQARLVDDRIKAIRTKEDDDKLLWTAVAIGLGLLAAIPTGGSSVVAGLAAAGAIGGAAISAYRAYDEVKDASLQAAAADTNLDKAQSISKEEPEYFWLALDIIGAIADVVAAGAAFKALRGAMRAAKLEELASLRKLAQECDAAKLAPASRGRAFSSALSKGGTGGRLVSLDEMLQVFKKITPPPGEEKVLEYCTKMAEKMIAEDKVLTFRPGHELEDATAWVKRAKPNLSEQAAREEAEAYAEAIKANALGGYDHEHDIVVVRNVGTPESVAGAFVHEITHQKQKMMGILNKVTDFESEISAFASERDFLKLVPIEALPEDSRWLREASDGQIFLHVCEEYGIAAAEAAKPSDTWMLMLAELRKGK